MKLSTDVSSASRHPATPATRETLHLPILISIAFYSVLQCTVCTIGEHVNVYTSTSLFLNELTINRLDAQKPYYIFYTTVQNTFKVII
jgi:hypothetical protein